MIIHSIKWSNQNDDQIIAIDWFSSYILGWFIACYLTPMEKVCFSSALNSNKKENWFGHENRLKGKIKEEDLLSKKKGV